MPEQNTIPIPSHSEEVHDILSYMPTWLIRWGITVVFMGVAILMGLSWYIQYPDVVPGRVKITTTNPPAKIVARASGPLKLLVTEKTIVEKGEIIALIENPVAYEDVTKLQANLTDFKEKLDLGWAMTYYKLDESLNLGELQQPFNALIKSFKTYQAVGSTGKNNGVRKNIIKRQINEYNGISEKLGRRVALLETEYKNLYEHYENRYKPLLKSGGISAEQLEKKEQEIIQKMKEIELSRTAFNENNNQVLSLQRQLVELDFKHDDESTETINNVHNAFANLQSQISIWEQRYLLKSPIEGEVNYLQFTKDNMYVNAEQEIVSIIPAFEEKMVGELFISEIGSGKVDTGQTVHIMFDSYPKKEFGVVKGKIETIADIAVDDLYRIHVSLPNELQTTANKALPFRHDMQGTGEIITKKLRLIERIFNEISEAFRQE